MKRIVFVDGENLNYKLRDFNKSECGDGGRDFLQNFNYRGIIEEVLAGVKIDKIYWFGAKIKVRSNRPEIIEKANTIKKRHAEFSNLLRKQGIDFVKIGFLRAREVFDEDAGEYLSTNLTEKGVDIGMAVKMIEERMNDSDVEIIFTSADTDLLPALEYLKKLNTRLVYVGYEDGQIFSFQKIVGSMRVITKAMFLNNKQFINS